MTTQHIKDQWHGDYELSFYRHDDGMRTLYSVDIKDHGSIIIGAFGELTTISEAEVVGRAFVGGAVWGLERAAANFKRQPAPLPRPTAYRSVLMPGVLSTVASLVTEGDVENPEYDRALVEVVGRLLDLDLESQETRDAIIALLRGLS